MPIRSAMKAIYILRKLIKRFREKKTDPRMKFIDLEKNLS